jgi:hypothetical protein
MSEFLAALSTFPAVVFTSLLAFLSLYWLTVIAGLFDIDILSPDFVHHDGELDGGGHTPHGFLEFLSIGKVPVTITISAFVLFGWLISMAGELFLRPTLGPMISQGLFSTASMAATIITAVLLSSFAVRPIRGLFTVHTEHGEAGLVGRMVKISSRTVDQRFGTAVCDVAGPDLLLNVVCREGVSLRRDDMAVVVEFDATRQVYLVAPFSHTPADGGSTPVQPALPPSPASTPPAPVSLERQSERPH